MGGTSISFKLSPSSPHRNRQKNSIVPLFSGPGKCLPKCTSSKRLLVWWSAQADNQHDDVHKLALWSLGADQPTALLGMLISSESFDNA